MNGVRSKLGPILLNISATLMCVIIGCGSFYVLLLTDAPQAIKNMSLCSGVFAALGYSALVASWRDSRS